MTTSEGYRSYSPGPGRSTPSARHSAPPASSTATYRRPRRTCAASVRSSRGTAAATGSSPARGGDSRRCSPSSAAAGHSYMSRHEGVPATLAAWGPMKVGWNRDGGGGQLAAARGDLPRALGWLS